MNDGIEQKWVRSARAGDRLAFDRLIDTYWDRLRRWLYGMCGDEQTAEDLTQEAIAKAWTRLGSLKEDRFFAAWLFRIGRNGLLNHRRHRNSRLPPEPLPHHLADARGNPTALVQEREGEQALQKALDKLPADYRSAYLLWVREEMPYLEIGLVLAISPKKARWRVCKARQMLVRELQSFLEWPSK